MIAGDVSYEKDEGYLGIWIKKLQKMIKTGNF
jgi:hypothetical protein